MERKPDCSLLRSRDASRFLDVPFSKRMQRAIQWFPGDTDDTLLYRHNTDEYKSLNEGIAARSPGPIRAGLAVSPLPESGGMRVDAYSQVAGHTGSGSGTLERSI